MFEIRDNLESELHHSNLKIFALQGIEFQLEPF